MSKELEAFDRVWEDCSKLDLDYVSKHNLMDDLREIKKALTPPTADEVCEELERYVPHKVTYNKERYSFESYSHFGTTFTICQFHENTNISWNNTIQLKLKTLSLIIHFYEGLEGK